MAMAATAFKDMLSISIKPRHDSQTDQYNRIFMMKFFLISSVIMGLSWYTDSINCIVPKSHGVDGGFVSSTCWIQGVYVYKALGNNEEHVGYYGIPKDIDADGYLYTNPDHLCSMNPKAVNFKVPKKNPACRPFEKTFYLQYQYMPFLTAAMALVFFVPYIFFKTINADLIALKNEVKSEKPDAEKIAEHYFNNRSNPQRNNRFRILLNVLVKIMYIAANLVNFMVFDFVLNSDFRTYGNQWVAWSQLKNTIMYDYLGERDHPKPGNVLLPPFGYCEVYSSAKDIKQSVANKHKYVCELSQNILYQYVLMVIWFSLVVGILVSAIGLLVLLVHYFIGILGLKGNTPSTQRILKSLSFREREYLEYIRKKNVGLYGEVMEKLTENRLGPLAPPTDEFPSKGKSGSFSDKKPGFDF